MQIGSTGDGAVHSELSGSADDVVQARDVSGGVHFHRVPVTAESVPIPRQLPADVRGFVGREMELAALAGVVDPARGGTNLVVLAGMAGAGKTSLAIRFASQIRQRFPDGQLFVNLRGYDPGPPMEPAAVLERFLRALGRSPGEIPLDLDERAETYRTLVADRRILVLLDNAATAAQVRPLLPGQGHSVTIVTSRNRLSPLAAHDGARRLVVGLLDEGQACALIRHVIGEHRHGDAPEQIVELARLCARLPLALRIAAERAAARPLMPLSELIADLREQSSRWTALSSDGQPDSDAVRGVFAWSYRALPEPEARLFRLLGLHPGPDFDSGVVSVLAEEPSRRTRELLDTLVAAHLLEQIKQDRYQFHDLLRAYATEMAVIEDSPESRREALERAGRWYLHCAEAALRVTETLFFSVVDDVLPANDGVCEQRFADGRQAGLWYRAERANLQALARSAATAELNEVVWKLAVSTSALHVAHGSIDDYLESAQAGLAAARRLRDRRGEAHSLQNLGFAYKTVPELERAADCHKAALDAYNDIGDTRGTIAAVNSLGVIHLHLRELDRAAEYFQEAARLAQQFEDYVWHALALVNLGDVRMQQGKPDLGVGLAEDALRLLAGRVVIGEAQLQPLDLLIHAHLDAGRLDMAEQWLDKAAEVVSGGVRHQWLENSIRFLYATLLSKRGCIVDALDAYLECLRRNCLAGRRSHEASCRTAIGSVLVRLDRLDEALKEHRQACDLRRALPYPFELAEALAALASALNAAGDQREALEVRAEALALLVGYSDLRATSLREDLECGS